MKEVVILLNGEPYKGDMIRGDYVICCDGAYSWAKGRIGIDENLGDFDSLSEQPVPAPRFRYPAEKDETDGELAVDRAIGLKADRILFYGGGGGRADHFLGNLHLLLKAVRAGMQAAMRLNGCEIELCGAGEHGFSCRRGQTVSLVPFGGDAHIMEGRGLYYPVNGLWLRCGSTRGISNETTGDSFTLRIRSGFVLVVLNT